MIPPTDNCPVFAALARPLLNPASPLRHIPLRIYIPHPDSDTNNTGSFRVIQGLVPPRLPNNDHQTLGHALHTLIPALFPSRRDPILAAAILHGARVPLHATLEDLMRECAYADGWVAVSNKQKRANSQIANRKSHAAQTQKAKAKQGQIKFAKNTHKMI
ncbi:hypothetical protein V501_09229, partial [Pseudogymnoascus sp. VKM F-4519 (FW-2642)]